MLPKFYALLRFLPGREALALAPLLEECGFDGATIPEHVVTQHSPPNSYPYSADGQPPFRLDSAFPEPFVLIGALATLTTRLRFLTAVVVAPLRSPLLLARAAGTADVLSGGRVALGIGVGREAEDYAALGAEFETRGPRMDEAIEVMRTLWREGPVEYLGRFTSFGPVYMEPVPERPLPILIGGGSDAAIRRAVRLGDGAIAPGTPFERVEEYLGRLRASLAAAGRDRASFEIVATCPSSATLEDVVRFGRLGVDVVQVVPWPNPGKIDTKLDEKKQALERFASVILAPARRELAEVQL